MTVEEIVKAWLAEHGYDGLCTDGCGCQVGNLFPCGEGYGGCIPGHNCPMPPEKTCPSCNREDALEGLFWICPRPEARRPEKEVKA